MCMMNEPTSSLKRSLPACSSSEAPPLKVRRILSSLPSRMVKPTLDNASENDVSSSQTKTSPQDSLVSLVESKGGAVIISPALTLEGFFAEPTEAEINAYTNDVVCAVRSRDIEKLREFHASGRPLKCSNRYGESLLHMACRRGFVDVATFLITEAGVTVQVRDDYGRTPLHDVCWTCEPNFELLELVMAACPELLFMSDRRGNTPLDYARPEHWDAYNKFLSERQDLLSVITQDEIKLEQYR